MKNFFITGGTSGIGYNCIKHLAHNHDNRILMISSNLTKGNLAVKSLKQFTKKSCVL